MKTWAPLTDFKRSASSSLSWIPAPLVSSMISYVNVFPPISWVRISPSRTYGRACSSKVLYPSPPSGSLNPPLFFNSLSISFVLYHLSFSSWAAILSCMSLACLVIVPICFFSLSPVSDSSDSFSSSNYWVDPSFFWAWTAMVGLPIDRSNMIASDTDIRKAITKIVFINLIFYKFNYINHFDQK